MTTAIVWFRRDLRLADNPALTSAVQAGQDILPLYIHAPAEAGAWAPGAASRWWLHHSLDALDAQWGRHRGSLHRRIGTSIDNLLAVAKASGATAVYWNRLYDPADRKLDAAVEKALQAHGIETFIYNANLWREPWQTATQQDMPYRVFTPFWRNLRTQIDEAEPFPVPSQLNVATVAGSIPLSSFGLLPKLDWARGFDEHWTPGEAGAQDMLDVFADDALGHYAEGRDIPARHGTSRLSPHLHFGEISPRQIHAGLRARADKRDSRHRPDLEPYLRQLGWREFGHHLLYHFPKTPKSNFNDKFDRFRWADPDPVAMHAWQTGRTGIPFVDAGMRELWTTGWMHNRVRMVVASLLTKNLRQHWYAGARYFWDTLVDADLANNTMGWQWVGGSGADAAPYFRVFNPVTQGQRFDPAASYIRRWIPELAKASDKLVHTPWDDPGLLKASGYPAPIVDLKSSRDDALVAYQNLRGA